MSTTFVYCARSWRVSTMLATLSKPLTSPPVTMDTIDLVALERPLLYIRLHDVPGQPYLYGDGFVTALSAKQVRSLKLPNSLVFLEGCYGAQFSEAFLESGAMAVVGSDEPTYGKRFLLGPATLIGKSWLRGVRAGMDVAAALGKAVAGKDKERWVIAGNEKARLEYG